jgi:2'-5' RNA ligase
MPALEGAAERLFVGVPVPEPVRLALSRQIPTFLPGRQSPLENWHFTLRFIGNADSDQRARLIASLGSTSFGKSFDIEFDRLGAFPNPRRARVVWVGVANGKTALEKVADKVEKAVVAAGFEPEPRKFSAHLTISRLRQPEPISEFLAKAQEIDARMQVDEVILYRSKLGSGHSIYSVVAAFPLYHR